MRFLQRIILIVSIFFNCIKISAQSSNKILLTDVELQYAITEAMNDLYNFKFEKCDSAFNVLKKNYPNHPLPYFLLGYSQYWRILPNEENTQFDEKFYAYMDTVIDLSEKLYDRNNKNFEAIFFLTAAHSFNGRRRSDNKEWARATLSGTKGLNYLKEGREFNDLSPEFLFGEGMFNYYAEWIPENYKAFKPIMWFYPKGNKQLGIKYLRECTQNAFYTRVEAMHYLMRILLFEEKQDTAAYTLAKYLHQNYPDNPVFHRMYARVLHSLGRVAECEKVSREIYKKYEEKYIGYEENTARYATFYIGWYNRYRNRELAKEFLKKNVEISEKIGAVKMYYYLYSLEALADMALEEKDKELAKKYLEKIQKNTDKKSEMRQRARKKILTMEND
jgi:hypothetical protein